MKTLLQVTSSIFAHEGQSSRLAKFFVDSWKSLNPDGRVITRDLAARPLPHLDAERFGSFLAAPKDRTPEQARIVAESDALIAELHAADEVVLGLPMYNFSLPSQLKAWFDHIARAGVTFRYTENGPEGLLENRPVHVIATRGGQYAGTGADTQTALVRQFFAFLGLTDLRFVYAEGLNLGEAAQRSALAGARDALVRLAA